MFRSIFLRAAALVTASSLGVVWSQAPGSPPTCPEWTVDSDQDDSFLGAGMASAGDVNGDGYGDVIVGAPGYDNGQSGEGRAYVYLGSANGLSSTPAWTVESDQAGADLGVSVSGAGDVNGDGYADVIVGSFLFSNGQASEGIALVYLGSSTGLATVPASLLECDQANARFGESVSSGDFNGDGYGDVVVGARLFDHGQTNEGRAFVYLGSASGLSLTPAWTGEPDDADAQFGRVAGAGDTNGDGYDDVLVGAPGFDGKGRAYVYLGSSSGPETVASWVEDGESFGGFFGPPFGGSLAGAGDVNGDGYDDVLVADQVWDLSGVKVAGKAYLYLGSSTGLATSPAWTDQGTWETGYFGASVAGLGDVNADGFDDWVASNHIAYTGELRVYYGSSSALSDTPAWIFEVPLEESDAMGGAARDVNADGYGDVLFGWRETFASPTHSHLELYLGSLVGFARSVVYAGDGINKDTVEPVNIVLGSTWSAPLTVSPGPAHGHGSGGPITLIVRTTAINGPTITSPVGGRLTEKLTSGPVLARISSTHGGANGDIPPQAVPNDPSLLGVAWAAQYIVLGGGFADFSLAVRGVMTNCP
jgi:hypothetical protein